jgi:FeS assembly protein SufD
MNAATERGIDGAVRELLSAAQMPLSRGDVVAQLQRQGMPHAGIEAWRFTPLGQLAEQSLTLGTAGDAPGPDSLGDLLPMLSDSGSLLLLDGVPVGLPVFPEGVTLSLGASSRPAAASSYDDVRDGFALLNEALHGQSVEVVVAEGVQLEKPLELVLVALGHGGASLALPHVRLRLEAGARASVRVAACSVVGTTAIVSSEVLVAELGRGASLTLARVALGGQSGFTVAEWTARQAEDSKLTLQVASCGGRLSRLAVRVLLEGTGATAEVDSLYLSGSGELVDHHFLVDHRAAGCTSRMGCRGIVDGGGRAVFDGRSFVRREAPRSDARQETRNLLLADDAVLNAKPHLEIDNDDVICSHGATVGRLDDEALFYMRSRGIDGETARALLTRAFVGQVMERMAAVVPIFWIEQIRSRLPSAASLSEADSDFGGAE